MKFIPNIILPVIENQISSNKNIYETLRNKQVVIFGLPGAFTPTCSEKHLPGYIELYDSICNKNIDDIYCLSVNDPFVMLSWFASFKNLNKIKGIADGNGEFSDSLELLVSKKKSFMGLRCSRFSLLANNNKIEKLFVEKEGEYKISTAENILKNIN